MKTPALSVIILLALPALVARAESPADQKIEESAASSYNFRTVLNDQVKAKAQDGVVTLTGTVLDRSQKTLAENTVRSLPGVRRVDDQITVSPQAPEQSDGKIALMVRSALLLHANVSLTDTDVAVHDGVVTLTGTAGSEAQKELTEAYAQDVDGVKQVMNEIQVHAPGPGTGENEHSGTIGGAIDDASITAQVKYELLTHHSTSALKTAVDTRSGAVVIRGEAGSAAEKDLVTRLTRDIKGVVSVDNEMTVPAGE